jgi:hypothetical protein
MTEPVTDAFRTIAPGNAIPNDFVVPYYLDGRKRRIAIARVDNRLYAFDDPAPARHARSPGACSQGRRSCANATAPGSTSPPEP